MVFDLSSREVVSRTTTAGRCAPGLLVVVGCRPHDRGRHDTFAARAAEVYGAHLVAPPTTCRPPARVHCGAVDMDGQTSMSVLRAGQRDPLALGGKRSSVRRRLRPGRCRRLFLFPHEFVRGEMAIPAWDDPERSFRSEVLAASSSPTSGGAPLGEYFSPEKRLEPLRDARVASVVAAKPHTAR